MQNFTNDTIDTTTLPRFEEVVFTALHKSYWWVVLINIVFVFVIIAAALAFGVYNIEEWSAYLPQIIGVVILLFVLTLWIGYIGFKKRAYAFRSHDVLFRHGVIATNTIVIPYNRVQHVALHEGIISRYLGLAKVQIFTAGGSAGDIEIPGIEKEQAENIKQLLMGKIQKQL